MRTKLRALLVAMVLLLSMLVVGAGFATNASAQRASCTSATFNVWSSGTKDCFKNSPTFDEPVSLGATTEVQNGNATTVTYYYYPCLAWNNDPICYNGGVKTFTIGKNQTVYYSDIDIVRIHYTNINT